MQFLAQAAEPVAAAGGAWPFVVLAISVGFIIFAIVVLRLHAFLALILAAFLTGILTSIRTGARWEDAIEAAAKGFGATAVGVGIVIALASIIGMCLMESGAADKIVRRFIRFFGEKRAGLAMLASGFFLSIPVFFDTVFFLLIPLARALSIRAGGNFMLYVMAIGGAGAITHSIVPPTPGPLFLSAELEIELGITMVAGFLGGIIPAICVWYMAKWLNRVLPIPVRSGVGTSTADMESILNKKDNELPSFAISLAPILVPAIFIAFASFLNMAVGNMPGVVAAFGGEAYFPTVQAVFNFIGNKNIALTLGALMAMGIYWRQANLTLSGLTERIGPSLEAAGVIILITCAGGAFGAMIRNAGVGESIKQAAEGSNISYILLAWGVTAIIRIAQGSATVSMITGSALMVTVIGDGSALPYHPIYIYLAIGFGSIILSWMNDSGFWVVGKLSGFTEKETLKSWTVTLTVVSIVGLIQTLVLAAIIPLR